MAVIAPKDEIEILAKEISGNRRIEETLANALRDISLFAFSKPEQVVLEMIQNAEDACMDMGIKTGKITFSINDKRLKVINNGRPFNSNDVNCLCSLRTSKRAEKGYIGYMGVGFKSVFQISDSVEVYSGESDRFYQFKFEKEKDRLIPWQLIPVWMGQPSENIDRVATTFVINYKSLQARKEILVVARNFDIRHLLCLRYVHNVSFVDELECVTWEFKRVEKDVITLLEASGERKEQERWRTFRRDVQIPIEIRRDEHTVEWGRGKVETRTIMVAIRVEDDKLQDKSPGGVYHGVYSYIPLKGMEVGLPFIIHGDFLTDLSKGIILPDKDWNTFMLGKIKEFIVTEVIEILKKHPAWCYQIWKVFYRDSGEEFVDGHLMCPLKKTLFESPILKAEDGSFIKPSEALMPCSEEDRKLFKLLPRSLVPPGKMVDPKIGEISEIRLIDFTSSHEHLLREEKNFKIILGSPNKFEILKILYKKAPHNRSLPILTSEDEVVSSSQVFLPPKDTMAQEMLNCIKKPIVHPKLLEGADGTEVEEALKSRLTVNPANIITVSKEYVEYRFEKWDELSKEDRLKVTQIWKGCIVSEVIHKYPQPPQVLAEHEGCEEWMTPSKVYFSIKYNSDEILEKTLRKLRRPLLSPEYLNYSDDPKGYQKAFSVVGVKDNLEPRDRESLAKLYAKDYLKQQGYSDENIKDCDQDKFGYDLVASKGNKAIYVEVKGRAKWESEVDLSLSGSKKAQEVGGDYYFYYFPELPKLTGICLQDPFLKGKHDKITITRELLQKEGLQFKV